jgi:hypothetical protein
MERSEEGDAREIAAWQIAGPGHRKLCLESLQHLVTKNLYRCRYCRSLFQVGWGIFEVWISFLMKLQWSRAYWYVPKTLGALSYFHEVTAQQHHLCFAASLTSSKPSSWLFLEVELIYCHSERTCKLDGSGLRGRSYLASRAGKQHWISLWWPLVDFYRARSTTSAVLPNA